MSNFIQTTLGDLVSKEKKSIISGPFGSNIGKIFFKTEGIPVIRGNNLSTGGEKFKDDGFVFITREKADELNCYAIKNDLIFTAVGTIGQVGIIDEKLNYDEYVISNKQLRVRFDTNKITPLFAYYWFSSYWIQKIILQRNVGSTVPLINLSVLKGLPITLPKSIAVQHKIVEVLENLSGKIELNNKINAELEAMAKTLYDYWFVQFDFPDKDGKPYKSSGGKMVWNEELKREIPEGWEVKKINSKIKIGSGFPFDSSKYLNKGDYKIITIKNVQDLRIDTENVDYINEIPEKINPFCILEIGDVLMSLTGNVGRICIVPENNLLLNQRVGKIICDELYKNFSYFFFQRIEERQRLEKIATGSSQKNLSPIDAVESKALFPSEEILKKFNQITDPIMNRNILSIKENQQLASLRDWLLPMLMNGQVRVGDVEEELGMVAVGNVEYKKG